jgi:Trehalase
MKRPLTGIIALLLGTLCLMAACCAFRVEVRAQDFQVLNPEKFSHYIRHFNEMEDENWTNMVSNARSEEWLRANVPYFECADPEVEELYYFRWWSFRKHLVQTTNGVVVTEFLVPMRHAGAYNTIICAVGHHLAEGRWLRDDRYVNEYIRFWFRSNAGKPPVHFHKYSSWFAAAVYDRYLVNQDRKFAVGLLDDLVADYRVWEQERQLTNGLFWQYDVRDGMEESISGSRTQQYMRPTINSYMFGNARALAAVARLAGRSELAREFDAKAAALKRQVETTLWNPTANFFEVRHPDGVFADVREQLGFIPWFFELPSPGRECAWLQLADPQGFCAPYGVTTAERRAPGFRSHGCCKCEWDGAVWPFATCQTLKALANVLRDYPTCVVSSKDYFNTFMTYAQSQHFEGKPYIGEYLDEVTGQWLKGKQERSRYYNHSTFADLVITGLAGLCPRADETIELRPLLPEGTWDWFCLDALPYHGRKLTIIWDQDGKHYGRGQGLSLMVNGKTLARSANLGKLEVKLP